jgi:dTDP-4-amino-4,6-dideoxygalactose transaminase
VDERAFGLTRNELASALEAENIETRNYYDPPVHRQTAYKRFARPDGRLPNTDLLSRASLSLPIWSDMEPAVVSKICAAVRLAHESAGEIRASLRAEAGALACATGRPR